LREELDIALDHSRNEKSYMSIEKVFRAVLAFVLALLIGIAITALIGIGVPVLLGEEAAWMLLFVLIPVGVVVLILVVWLTYVFYRRLGRYLSEE